MEETAICAPLVVICRLSRDLSRTDRLWRGRQAGRPGQTLTSSNTTYRPTVLVFARQEPSQQGTATQQGFRGRLRVPQRLRGDGVRQQSLLVRGYYCSVVTRARGGGINAPGCKPTHKSALLCTYFLLAFFSGGTAALVAMLLSYSRDAGFLPYIKPFVHIVYQCVFTRCLCRCWRCDATFLACFDGASIEPGR